MKTGLSSTLLTSLHVVRLVIDMMMLKDEDWLVQYLAHKPARGMACHLRSWVPNMKTGWSSTLPTSLQEVRLVICVLESRIMFRCRRTRKVAFPFNPLRSMMYVNLSKSLLQCCGSGSVSRGTDPDPTLAPDPGSDPSITRQE
jgi:hypothetical protein